MTLTIPQVGQVLKWVGGNIDFIVFTEGATDDIDLSGFLLGISTSGGAERWGQAFKVGTCDLIFDNTTGIFSSDAQVAKPFTKLFRPGRKVTVVTVPNPDTPTDYKPFFAGIIDSIDEDYGAAGFDNTVAVRCLDNGAVFQGYNPPMGVPTGVQYSHERVGSALDLLSWPAGLRDIDTGFHRLQSSFLAQSVWTECQQAAAAEGGMFWAGPDGTAVFRNRSFLTEERDPEVINSFLAPAEAVAFTESLRGLASDGYYLWSLNVLDTGAGGLVGEIRKFDRTGTQVAVFAAPEVLDTSSAAGWELAYDGLYLYVLADLGAVGFVVAVDPDDGTVIQEYSGFGGGNQAIAGDGNGLFWILEGDIIKKYGLAGGVTSSLGSVPYPGTSGTGRGMTYDGTFLYVTDTTTDEILRIWPLTGLVDHAFPAPDVNISGLAFDGLYLWALDEITELVYQIERHRPTTVQGYIGYSDPPLNTQVGHLTDVATNFEIARVKNQVRFARVGSVMQEANDLWSQDEYGLRSYERTDYKNSIDDDVLFLSEQHLAKHSLPRLRVESATYSGTYDPLNQDRNHLLWDLRYGDALMVKVISGEGWSFERLVNVLGITHRVTANDWVVTVRLDDSLSNFALERSRLVASLDAVAWWSFDVNATADRSGNGHALTWNSAPTWATTGGPVPDLSPSGVPIPGDDGMVTLDGVDDWATVAAETDLELAEDLSIEAWVRFDSLIGFDPIISCDGVGGADALYHLSRETDHFRLLVNDSVSGQEIYSLTPLVVDTFYHVVATLEWTSGGLRFSLYVNGEKDALDVEHTLQPVVVARTVQVGFDNTISAVPFDGSISELAVYRGALTEAQVSNLYRSGY